MKLPKLLQPRPIAWGGLEVSLQDDISSFVMIIPEGENVRADCRFWIPKDSLSHPKLRNAPIWKSMSVTSGRYADYYDQIATELAYEKQRVRLRGLGFDRWGDTLMMRSLGRQVIGFGQGFASMTQPLKVFLHLQATGKLQCDDPILGWMINNLTVRTDVAGNIKPDENKSKGSISGVIALLMAIGLWISPS